MINLAYLVVGVVVVEVVFAYPGMGQYLVDHVSKRDVPVVQAGGLVFAAVYIGLNLIADVVSILANPRLRHPEMTFSAFFPEKMRLSRRPGGFAKQMRSAPRPPVSAASLNATAQVIERASPMKNIPISRQCHRPVLSPAFIS